MATLRHRIMDLQTNLPVSGHRATVTVLDPAAPGGTDGTYARSKVLTAISDLNGWVSWDLPPIPLPGLTVLVRGIETQTVVVKVPASVSTGVTTVTQTRIGTLPPGPGAQPADNSGDLVTRGELIALLVQLVSDTANLDGLQKLDLVSAPSRTADTARVHVVSYQKQETENNNNGGEGVWLDLADPRAKNMLTWRLAMDKVARTVRTIGPSPTAPPESDMQRIVWAGAHYYAQDQVDYAHPTDVHGHWSIEVPDSTLALRTRLEVRFVGPDGKVGLDKTIIQTATADLVVDTSNGQVLRLRSGPGAPRLMEVANDEWGVHPRWRLGAPVNQPETGGGAGSNFAIGCFSDTDSFIGWALAIKRSNGQVYLGGSSTIPGQTDGSMEGLTVNRNHAGTAVAVNTNLTGATGATAYAHTALDAASRALDSRVGNDASARFVAFADGKHEWGPGTARDVNLYRGGVDLLKTDDDLSAHSFTADSAVRALFAKTTSATDHAATIYQASTTGVDTAAALNVVSDNSESSAMYLSGTETNRGTLKVAHRGRADASDASASALSIDLQVAGTAAQGIFVTGTAGPTSGNLLTLRNNGREDFVVKGTGRAGLGVAIGSTPAGMLDVRPYDDVTPGIAVQGRATGTDLVQARRNTDGAVRTRISRDCQLITQETAFFTGPAVQIGPTASTQVGGGTNCLGLGNASIVPSTNPTGGGVMYAEAGALKWRGSSGTVTVLAPA